MTQILFVSSQLRPPQPAIYLFLLDVSMIAQQSGYLRCVCESLAEHLETMPGDARTQVGFVAYNSAVHFYSLAEGFNQPHEITVVDIDDPFLPCPDNLLINLSECKELIKDLLQQLPNRFANSHDSNSALGAALQVAYKLMVSLQTYMRNIRARLRFFSSYTFCVFTFCATATNGRSCNRIPDMFAKCWPRSAAIA